MKGKTPQKFKIKFNNNIMDIVKFACLLFKRERPDK